MEQSVTEDTIQDCDDIPTQQSNTKKKVAKRAKSATEKVIEDGLAAGTLKTASLKRRAKSERIAKRGKPFKFPADGSGSTPDKAWDVDEVLAEE